MTKEYSICEECKNKFIPKDPRFHKFCSQSCSAIYNNKKYPKRKKGYVSPKELAKSLECKERNEIIKQKKRAEREKNFVRQNAEYPYDDYFLYKTYHKKEGRYFVSLVHKDGGKKNAFTSYARYLMCVKEKRILDKKEQVDHINEDKTDDRIENLQILTQEENTKKYLKRKNIGRMFVKLKCPNCGKIFIRPRNRTHLCRPSNYTGCSRYCSGIISHKIIDEENFDLSNNIIEIYKVPFISDE